MDEVILRGKNCLSSRDVLNTKEGGRGGKKEESEGRKGRTFQALVPTECVQLEEQNNNVKQTLKVINMTTPSGESPWYLQDNMTARV